MSLLQKYAYTIILLFWIPFTLFSQEMKLGIPLGHNDWVTSSSFSQDGNLVITNGYKSMLWDVKLGRLLAEDEELRRLLAEDTKLRKLFGMDLESERVDSTHEVKGEQLSPDGKLIAIFGDNNNTITLKDANSGNLIKTLKSEDWIFFDSFSFSPNGKKIVATVTGSTAKHGGLWDIETGNFTFLNGDVVQFSPDSKYILAAIDEIPYIYDTKTGKRIHELVGKTTFFKFSHFDLEGKRVATVNPNEALIWNMESGKLLQTIHHELGDTDGTLKSLFSPNGKYLAITSDEGKLWDADTGKILDNVFISDDSYFSPDSSHLISKKNEDIQVWDIKSGKYRDDLKLYYQQLNTEKISPDGQLLLTNYASEKVKLWSVKSGKLLNVLESDLDSEIPINSIQFSPDGNLILGYSYSDYILHLWDAKSGKLVHTIDEGVNWLYGQGFKAQFNSDGKYIIIAYNNRTRFRNRFVVKLWDTKLNKTVFSQKGHKDLSYSPNGNYFITTPEDGSLLFWDSKTKTHLLRQFIFDSKEPLWLLPNGYYSGTKKAASKLYYIKGLQTIGFEQLDVKYNRPDKVLEVLGDITGTKDTTMIKAYKKAWQKRTRKLDIDTTSFQQGFSIPESDFSNRETIAYEQNSSELKLDIKAQDSTYLLDRFNIWINEVPIYGNKGISVRQKQKHSVDTTVNVKLSSGSNKIETSVLNINGIESYRLPLYVNYTPKQEIKEKLYFVGIGVDKYEEEGHTLNYSVKDIRDLSVQLKEKYGNRIEIDTLFNQSVTTSNILELKERLKTSKVDDKVIISFSGHGLLSEDLDYYLATYNVNFDSPEQNGLPYDDIEYLLDGIPSRKKLLLIDACHSGEVDKEDVEAITKLEQDKEGLKGSIGLRTKKSKMGMKNSFELMKELFNNVDRATGTTVISAAAGTQFAQERGDLKNGVFTYCILNQLKEKETISVSELNELVSKQVQDITNGLQQPTSRNETIENDWKVWE